MNKEIYDRLDNNTFRYILRCAYKGNYLVGLTRYNAEILRGIYEQLFPGRNKINVGCASCAFDMCVAIGKEFFEYEEKLSAENTEAEIKADENDIRKEVVIEPEIKASDPPAVKKKRTSKKRKL